MKSLTFHSLRVANEARLPQFRNLRGEVAHSKPDGSDWPVAQWVAAVMGELGEFADVRIAFELGFITRDEYERKAKKELADVVTYLDILARRALDETHAGTQADPTFELMQAIAELGLYANERKKFVRGDYTTEEFKHSGAPINLMRVHSHLKWLSMHDTEPTPGTTTAHPTGVDLGEATAEKFNEVSARVRSTIQLVPVEWISRPEDRVELVPHDSKTERFL